MPERTSIAGDELYQSQWWARLAAFSEKPQGRAPQKVSPKEKQPGFIKTLLALFRGLHHHEGAESHVNPHVQLS